MKNKLILIVGLAQFLLVIIGILIAVFDKKVCMTEMCGDLTKEIERRVDSKIDPCHDFYNFSCGKILREKIRPSILHNMLSAVQAIQHTRLVEILEEPPGENEPRAFRVGKILYKQCQVNETQEVQVHSLLKLIKKFGGFPAVEGDEWDESGWTFMDSVRKFRYAGLSINSLFTLEIYLRLDTTHEILLGVSNPRLTKSPRYLMLCDDVCKEKYIKSFVETVIKLGGVKEQATKDAEVTFEFEKELARNIIKHPELSGLKEQKKGLTTVANISKTYDFIDWLEYINIAVQNKAKFTADKIERIYLLNSGFMNGLKQIFQSTDKRVLANYMIWYGLKSFPYVLGENRSPADCLAWMKNRMKILLQALYLNRYHSEPFKAFVLHLFNKIKHTLENTVTASEWMDEKTKQRASEKVRDMFSRIGYPEKLLNITYINNLYEGVSVEKDYFTSMLNVEKFETDDIMSLLFKTFHDKRSWDFIIFSRAIAVYDVNAMYLMSDNSITISKGILDRPIFVSDWPKFINYGRIGSIVGHEVTHSLDTTGSQFDKDGLLRTWWTQRSWDLFNAKAQCFIDQFSNFSIFDGVLMKNLPGDLEIAENIADSGGLKLSFQAYRDFEESLFWPELLLPRLPYSQEQMFFISFAHLLCIQYISDMIPGVLSDVHAPKPFRVLGSIQNNPYFAQVFNCPNNSVMNPSKKCELW